MATGAMVPGGPVPSSAEVPDVPAASSATSTTPSTTERDRQDFEMREADLGPDVNDAIEKWLAEQIRVRKQQYEKLHKNQIPKWRDIAAGKPREPDKSFPWPNCANLVHQLAGQEIDNLVARVLGLVYATSPLQYYRYTAKVDDPHRAAEKANLLERFYDLVGYEPDELDLYQVDSQWLTDSARLGCAWVKCVIEHRIEAMVVGYDDQKKSAEFDDVQMYKGPKVEKLRFEDVLNDPYAQSPEKSVINIHIRSLSRKDLEERAFKGFFKQKVVDEILASPDRHGPSEVKKREARKKGVQTESGASILAEWDIYECWFKWFTAGRTYRLIYWWHDRTKKVLNRVFNFMPDNVLPLIRTKLNSGEEGMNGMGYAEMLESYQDEISTVKNQRIDATTMGILGVNRISPRNKNIDKYFQIFPGSAAPFGKDEFEHIPIGNPQMIQLSAENESMLIQQAHDRAGIAPAVAGSGVGKLDKKGNYGSMGTLSVMQDSNTVTNYRQSDFRHARVKLATVLTKMYAKFGMGQQGSMFGLDDALLEEAFEDFLRKKVRIPIRAATASANKEVEKQNGILMNQHLQAFHQNIVRMIQAVQNAAIPPDVQAFMYEVIKSEVAMEKRLLRDFGFDQPDQFVPETPREKQQKQQAVQPVQPQLPGQPGQPGPGGQPPVAGPGQPPGGSGPAGGIPGMGASDPRLAAVSSLLAGGGTGGNGRPGA